MADDSEDREIIEAFAEEAAELLRAAESALNAMLSASPEARAPLWNALLRGLHTVKGSAGFLGEGPLARKIEQRTHATEDKAKAVSEGRAPFTDAVIDSLAADIEAITAMVHELRTGEAAPASAHSQVEVFAAPATARDQHDEEASFASLFAGELRPETCVARRAPAARSSAAGHR